MKRVLSLSARAFPSTISDCSESLAKNAVGPPLSETAMICVGTGGILSANALEKSRCRCISVKEMI